MNGIVRLTLNKLYTSVKFKVWEIASLIVSSPETSYTKVLNDKSISLVLKATTQHSSFFLRLDHISTREIIPEMNWHILF